MFKGLIRALALLLFLASAPLAAQPAPAPIAPADLLRHIQVLASDGYQGRAPGTEGERLTTAYIVEQFRARGLEPAGENGTWFQSLHLAQRSPAGGELRWTAGGRTVAVPAASVALLGRDESTSIADARVIFAGHGARMPERGIDQLAGANVHGAVVLILLEGPQGVEGFPPPNDRVNAMFAAGAAAVIGIVGDDIPWAALRPALAQSMTYPESIPIPRLVAIVPVAAIQPLVAASGADLAHLLNDQPGSSFRAVTLRARVSIDAAMHVTRIQTSNVIGRVRGSGATRENLLLLAHWDHLGLCRPEGEADRICNGAVDNASGIASLIEIAGQVARGRRPVRDVLFMATTGEEMGLLGAAHFAQHPTLPLPSIVAAINMDTVAIAPAGAPVAVMGRGVPALDAAIDATIAAMGRRLDPDDEAASLVQRQDGWALTQAGVPAIMVGGSFSDMTLLETFLGDQGRYHKPSDQADSGLVLTGAAEDANLTVALARRLADPVAYARPRRAAQ
jgi:Zn-dependent M28 family amino/carboxypeptidase